MIFFSYDMTGTALNAGMWKSKFSPHGNLTLFEDKLDGQHGHFVDMTIVSQMSLMCRRELVTASKNGCLPPSGF